MAIFLEWEKIRFGYIQWFISVYTIGNISKACFHEGQVKTRTFVLAAGENITDGIQKGERLFGCYWFFFAGEM